MSYAIATTSLSGATMGTTGTVDWTQIAQSAGFPPPDAIPHLALFNESPCGLQLNFQTGEQITLPAGGWQTIALNAQCTRLTYQVLYVLNASPIVADLLGTWYAPDEPFPNMPILGNSPIGGTLTNITAQFLLGLSQSQMVTEEDSIVGPTLKPASGNNLGVSLGAYDLVGNFGQCVTAFMNAGPIQGVILGNNVVITNTVFTQYAGEFLAGIGVPCIVAVSQATLVTATTLQTPITYTTPNDGNKHSYRISAYFLIANGTSGNNLTYQWSYTDFTGVVRTDTGSMLGSTTGWGGGTSIGNSRYTAYPAFFTANPNTTITVTFRDPTNTPHDTLSVFLERLS